MLREVLSPDDCAVCGFCCSFRRQSLNLTPCFAKETFGEIRRLYPEARFRDLPNGAVTIDISDNYRTNDSEEEALCPFNRKGCILPGHLKPGKLRVEAQGNGRGRRRRELSADPD